MAVSLFLYSFYIIVQAVSYNINNTTGVRMDTHMLYASSKVDFVNKCQIGKVHNILN